MKRSTYLTDFSKNLRAQPTLWEEKLWKYLRAGRFNGLKFKRQVPIKDYIADFCCNRLKLIIELDGAGHRYSETDGIRDANLQNLGYTILRFWNYDVKNNIEKVLKKIELCCMKLNKKAEFKNLSLSNSLHSWREKL